MTDTYTAPMPAQMSPASVANSTVATPMSAAAPQQSATDRLEQLLKQLQEEQVAPIAPVVAATTAASTPQATLSQPATQDFASVLSRIPAPSEPANLPNTPTVLNSLDEVIRTIGERYAMGQPDLPELLATTKQTTNAMSAPMTTAPAPASTQTVTVAPPTPPEEPMVFVRPPSGMPPQAPAALSPELPKVTVMPPAEAPMNAVPTSAPMVVPAAAAPASTSGLTPAFSVTPETQLKPRVLTQYLHNLAGHLKMHGQLNLPSYTKLAVAR